MQLILQKADDFHCHFRDGDYLTRTVSDTAKQFNRAIAMPNLKSPVTTTALAKQYYQRILQHVPAASTFKPLMTLYLQDQMDPNEIQIAKNSGVVFACKLYPAGATTNSAAGVNNIQALYPVIEAMQAADMPLLIHGETTDSTSDIFDREAHFIEQTLHKLVQDFPKLRIVLEHITTKTAVEFIQQASNNIAATITAHHLLLNRNDMLAGGIKPHHYCLPVLKRSTDQQALLHAATSGNPKFFLGTDSAPHTLNSKQSACGCAGIYTAHAALELYAIAFEMMNKLDRLNDFTSRFGAEFYQLPRNEGTITLAKKSWRVPDTLPFGDSVVVPLCAGKTLDWQVVDE